MATKIVQVVFKWVTTPRLDKNYWKNLKEKCYSFNSTRTNWILFVLIYSNWMEITITNNKLNGRWRIESNKRNKMGCKISPKKIQVRKRVRISNWKTPLYLFFFVHVFHSHHFHYYSTQTKISFHIFFFFLLIRWISM